MSLFDEDEKLSLRLKQIDFYDGISVPLEKDSILVFVGPNNAGKSLTLREVFGHLKNDKLAKKAIKAVWFIKTGDETAFIAHSQEWVLEVERVVHLFGGGALPADAHIGEWKNHRNNVYGASVTLFALLLNAGARIQATKPAPRIRLERQPASVPIHRLEAKIDAELAVSSAFASIFGQEISLNRNAGSEVPIHVGPRPDARALGGELSVRYSEEVAKLPLISEQGDGMIAFLGLLLYVVGVPRDIYLIDEPDVYLHPPQAYMAGHLLAKRTNERQLLLATHNAHFLRGLLDEAKDRLRLVRLDRTTGTQVVNVIDPNLFEEARNDPILKFTPILEALFYSWIMVCEDESDCLFYRAVLEENGHITETSPLFWISAHGKQNIRKIVGLLRSLGVQVISIVDFDILNDENVLKALVEAYGGDWSKIEGDSTEVRRSIERRKPTMATEDVKKEISKILDDIDSKAVSLFPATSETKIREIFKSASPWRELKSSGMQALDSGETTKAARRLLDSLARIGILVPSVGELESFCKTIGGHGIVWVQEALKRDLKTDPEFDEARKFAAQLAAKLTS